MQTLEMLVDDILQTQSLTSLTLSAATSRADDAARKVTVRPILLRKQRLYQFEYKYAQKVKHENLKAGESKGRILDLLGKSFRQGYFYTQDGDFQAVANAQGKIIVRTKGPAKPEAAEVTTPLSHDRAKNYLLAEGQPVDFLVRLGVMNADGKVLAAKRDKFKQINRFLEMVDDVAGSLPQSGPLRVIDFGCGKAYLTFALYHYFTALKGRDVQLVGLDLKEDVVAFCTTVAHDLDYSGLTFGVGDIAGYEGGEAADMVVTLHACDTATDDALVKAVSWGANVILSVPCCQHELFGQIKSDVLKPLLKHGILKERLTALVTDSVRASLLESAGYSVQILEFIALEHTSKNLLIRAVKRPGKGGPKPPSAEYEAFRDFWHVRPHMEAALDGWVREGDLTPALSFRKEREQE